jgi:uncharacterized membrane protein
MKASSFFTKEQQDHIRSAITEAEGNTSGEIRVHIETRLSGNALDRAAWIFRKIGMNKTENRNGVLFYLAVTNRKFAIIGDWGINTKVPDGFWDNIKGLLEKDFRDGKFTEGLVNGILMTGLQLKEHFPHQKDDVNELPDDISFDDPD